MSAFFGKLLYDLTLDQHCRCFTNRGDGAADLLEALGRCQELEDVNFAGCYGIPATAWQQLRGAKWQRLKKAIFDECLARERNGYCIIRCLFPKQCGNTWGSYGNGKRPGWLDRGGGRGSVRNSSLFSWFRACMFVSSVNFRSFRVAATDAHGFCL